MGNLKRARKEILEAKNQLSLDFGLGAMYDPMPEGPARAENGHGLTEREVRWILDDLVVSGIYDNNLMIDSIKHYGLRISPDPASEMDVYRKRNRFLESVAGRLTVADGQGPAT